MSPRRATRNTASASSRLGLLLATLLTSHCATSHTLDWWQRQPVYPPSSEPEPRSAPTRMTDPDAPDHPAIALVILPAAVVYDIITFPVQILWGYYPYGDRAEP